MSIIAPKYGSRNDSQTFAEYTRQNLEFIGEVYCNNPAEHVHPVTQAVNSMLGLVVFPWEKGFDDSLQKKNLTRLVAEGWPRIDVTLGKCETLGDLVWHLRNAAAHRRIKFSRESTDSNDPVITFSDRPLKGPDNWRVRMNASDLRTFCLRFIELLKKQS